MHSLPLIAAIDSAATTGFASLVSSVGFPIVAFGLVAWYIKYQDDKHREQIESIEESHREVEKSMTDALNANTQVLQRLLGVLDRSSNENK